MKTAVYFLICVFLVLISSSVTYLITTGSKPLSSMIYNPSSANLPLVYQKISKYQTDYRSMLSGSYYILVFSGRIKYLSGANFTITNGSTNLSFESDPNNKTHIVSFREKTASTSSYSNIQAKDMKVNDKVEISASVDPVNGLLIPNMVTRIID